MSISTYHEQLCKDYCTTSHSRTLALGAIRHGLVYVAEYDMTADILADATVLQRHSNGSLRLRFQLTNGQYHRLARRSKADVRVLCSVDVLEQKRAELIKRYATVKAGTFNNGRVFECLYSESIGVPWRYDPEEPSYDLASDVTTTSGETIQCKLTNGSITERSIINAMARYNNH